MDKNMIFFVKKIEDIFEKSLCNCYMSMLYFVCEKERDLEQPIIMLPLNEFA